VGLERNWDLDPLGRTNLTVHDRGTILGHILSEATATRSIQTRFRASSFRGSGTVPGT